MLGLCVFLSVVKLPHSGYELLSLRPAGEQGFHGPRILVESLCLQLTTQERFPDCSDQGFSLASFLSVNPSGQFVLFAQSPVSRAALRAVLLFYIPGDTQTPLENLCSPEPAGIRPVLGRAP